MNSTERVRNAILGKPIDRQPIYGWAEWNMKDKINSRWGSTAAMEDYYEFDAAHIFGGPPCFDDKLFEELRAREGELTPDLLVDADIYLSADDMRYYEEAKERIAFHKKRDRFCYMQIPGFFEHFNSVFGIENHLLYLLLYTEELEELYRRQAEWNIRVADHCIDLGVDMVHISDDWGAQKDILFSPELWWRLVYPNMKKVIDHCHSRGMLVSLHSDGCVSKVADGIAQLGFDVVHPWQENAGMSYDLYLEKYADKFAILGGICVQSAIGILPREELEQEIRRVFRTLKGKRWICCTSHFIQEHCSLEDLEFAYDLIYKLARE